MSESKDCKLKGADLTPEKLARKHSQFIGTIEKEIELGTKVEMEHTNDKKLARTISMIHIDEFSDYYTNKRYGLIANEKNLEKEKENKKESVLNRLGTILRENIGLSISDEAPTELTYQIKANDAIAGEITVNTSHPDLGKDCLEIIGFKLDPKYKTIKTGIDAVHSLWMAHLNANKIVVSPADESLEYWSKLGFEHLNNEYYILMRGH